MRPLIATSGMTMKAELLGEVVQHGADRGVLEVDSARIDRACDVAGCVVASPPGRSGRRRRGWGRLPAESAEDPAPPGASARIGVECQKGAELRRNARRITLFIVSSVIFPRLVSLTRFTSRPLALFAAVPARSIRVIPVRTDKVLY